MTTSEAESDVKCGCIANANGLLREHNTKVSQALMINVETSRMTFKLMVPTEKISSKVRKPAMQLVASFCPMCGVKL